MNPIAKHGNLGKAFAAAESTLPRALESRPTAFDRKAAFISLPGTFDHVSEPAGALLAHRRPRHGPSRRRPVGPVLHTAAKNCNQCERPVSPGALTIALFSRMK
jgi:hypothetical protein